MQSGVKKGVNRWQLGLALLFGVFLIGMAVSMALASLRASRVVDVDYYDHGLHYDQAHNGSSKAGFDWVITASLAGDRLQVRVKDQSGKAVAGGKLSFQPEPGRAGQPAKLALSEAEPGLLQAPRPLSPQGELRGTLRFTRGDAAASRRLVLFN